MVTVQGYASPAKAEFFGSTGLLFFLSRQEQARRFIHEAEDFVVFSPLFYKIDARAKSITDLVSNKKYTVDYYQREYKWQTRQILELLEDLEANFLDSYEEGHPRSEVEKYKHYFLGSIIVSHRDGKNFIIDGQQRLTSAIYVA